MRVAQLTADDLGGLVVADRVNDVGSWEVRLPDTVLDPYSGASVPHAAAAALRQEGAGIIITLLTSTGPQVVLSGPMTLATFAADETNLTGIWSISGVSDLVLLADALAYPDPATFDPDAQRADADARGGKAENLLISYVGNNIGSLAPAARRQGLRARLDTPPLAVNGRGPDLQKSPRFQNLLELCQEIALGTSLLFDIVQEGDRLKFVITEAADRTRTIRMDMANGLLKGVTYGYGAPSATFPLVGGKGEGVDRVIATATSGADVEARWGRRIERFYDERSTRDIVELEQRAAEAVVDGAASAEGIQASPADSDTMLYLRDWRKGDRVTVVVEGQEVPAPVTEVAIGVTSAALTIVATLGSADAFDVEAAAQSRATASASRISAIERTVEVPTPTDTGWVNITSQVTLAPLLAWSSGGTMHARRVGDLVTIRMDNVATTASGFFTTGPSGNIANTLLLSGVPAEFRPASFATPLATGASGRIASYYLTTAGSVYVGAIAPTSDWSGSTSFPAGEAFSFGGSYLI